MGKRAAALMAMVVAGAVGSAASAGIDERRPVRWSEWLDRDDASGDGDFERAVDFTASEKGCAAPSAIQARTRSGLEVTAAREFVVVTPRLGLACWNRRQGDQACFDYMVRFGCGSLEWSEWLDRDDPSAKGDYETAEDFSEKRKGCDAPVAIEARTAAGVDWTATGELLHVSPTVGLACANARQDDGRCLDYRVRFGCPVP
jgi:hypothetical protein